MELRDADTDTSITGGRLLDDDHDVVGVSSYGDDIADNCAVCGFAVGFYSLPESDHVPGGPRDHFGHSPRRNEDAAVWIEQNN